ncbi:hypothetical protein Hanom_Chr16g01517961 [Helianthus anomalus]
MDNVGSHNYQVVDFFWVNGVYSMTMVLWLLSGKNPRVIFWDGFGLLYVLTILLIILRIDGLPFGTDINIIFSFVVYTGYSSHDYFALCMFVVGCTFVIIGVILVIIVVHRMKTKDQESDVVILNTACALFLIGYTTLCYSWVKWGSCVWKILGIVLLGVLGLLTAVCCILQLVSRWLEYCKSRARVLPVPDPVNEA